MTDYVTTISAFVCGKIPDGGSAVSVIFFSPKRAGLFCLSQVRGGGCQISAAVTKNSEIWHVRRVHQYTRADEIAMLKIKPFFNYANLC